jgi:hypothetical protein
MIEMEYGLPYQHDNHMTIGEDQCGGQLCQGARESLDDKFLHAARVEVSKGKTFDHQVLLNQIGGFRWNIRF